MSNVGTLKELPYELSNTVANIYYKFCLLFKIRRTEGWWPKYSDNVEGEDPLENMVKFVQSYNKLKTDIKSIPDFLALLKNIRKDDIEQYKYWVEYVIDCLKYDIENINFKTIDQRKKERIEKAKQIQEIPNLIDLINV